MNKYFIFVCDHPLDILAIESLGHCYEDMYHITQVSEGVAYFLSPEEDEERVSNYLRRYFAGKMLVLISPFADEFMIGLAKSHLPFFPNQIVHPCDLLFKRISFGDYAFYQGLREYFVRMSLELIDTAAAYLRCGCNGIKAAKLLCVHRNTFNYRLSSFITQSGLDIRDYHNALLLEIYFQFRRGH